MTSTLVIGAGVIGTAIAHNLQKRGRVVTLVDRLAPGRGTSFGNMASIAVSEFMPASRPAVWRQIPGWMMDPEGPICVRPSYMPRLLPWFWRFLLASRPATLNKLEAAGAQLCKRALQDTQTLLADLNAASLMTSTGCLSLYQDEQEFKADSEHIALLDRYGFNYEVLGGNALRNLEPELSSVITKAMLLPDNRSLKDPFHFVRLLAARFEALGGTILQAEVKAVERGERITAVHLSDGRKLTPDEVVVCTGAYAGTLARQLGEAIPMETERGYHTQIMKPGIGLSHSIIWPARAFMVTPTAGGIRIGGTVEMAGLDAEPNFSRAKITVKRAKGALPNLQLEEATEWMGHRPALPDTIPVLSASAKTRGVYYAVGHGHLGLTYAATTAVLMGQLIAGETPAIDLSPYRVNRF
jgi:D-amino-acid dehydrogenase